ncbi:TetR family transcriptional regulator [Nocardia heshunensis]
MASQPRADSTRDRILAAAKAEFSGYGIAGARVDRIAKNARTSKERVYAYFRSKENLYGIVAAEELAAIAEATRIDPTDLPGYAGRIHDYFIAHPDRSRLMSWGQLELGGGSAENPAVEIMRRKTEQLRQAQADGHLDPSWEPVDVLMFVNQLAMTWAGQPELFLPDDPRERASLLATRRAAIVTAVERLFPASRPKAQP